MKKLITSILITTVILLSSCGGEPLTEEQEVFAGYWEAEDGYWLQIYLDGGGDFEMPSTTVNGGTTIITDSTLAITVIGLGATFSLDAPPKLVDNRWVMQLDGVYYFKE